MRKILLVTSLSVLAFSLFGCSDTSTSESTTQVEKSTQVESTTQAKTEISSEDTEKSTSASLSDEEYEKREQEQKQEAKELDAKILKIVSNVDSNINALSEEMANFPSDATEADLQSLEELASSVYNKITEDFYEANEIYADTSEIYPNSLVQYIINRQEFAQNIQFFAKTLEQQYMTKAQERLNNAEFVQTQLLSDRYNFLKDNGFTDKEIDNLAKEIIEN